MNYINENYNRDYLVAKNEILKSLIFLCRKPDEVILHRHQFQDVDKEFGNSSYSTIWKLIHDFKMKNPESSKVTLQDIMIESKRHEDTAKFCEDTEVFNLLKVITSANTETLSDNLTSSLETIKKYSLISSLKERGFNVQDYLKQTKEGVYENIDKVTLDEIKTKMFTEFEHLFENYDTSEEVTTYNLKDVDVSKEEVQAYGHLFANEAYNYFIGGQKEGVLFLRSALSGGSKSRQSLEDALSVACNEMFDTKSNNFKQIMAYVYNEETKDYEYQPQKTEPVVFMSTELNVISLRYASEAFISKVDEQIIRKRQYQEGDAIHQRILRAREIINNSQIFLQYIPNFTIKILEQEVRKYCTYYNCKKYYFDYIHLTPALSKEITSSLGNVSSQADWQILAKLARALERLVNQYNIFLSTSAQIIKNDIENRGQSSVSGSRMLVQPVDVSIQVVEPIEKDIKILKELGVDTSRVNIGHYLYKNRLGDSDIYIWCNMKKGNMSQDIIAVTNNIHSGAPKLINYKPISRFGETKKVTPQDYDKKEIEKCLRDIVGPNSIHLPQERIAKGVNDIALRMSAKGLQSANMENVASVYGEGNWQKIIEDANNLAKEKEKVPTFVEKPITSTLMKASNEPEDDVDLELLFG